MNKRVNEVLATTYCHIELKDYSLEEKEQSCEKITRAKENLFLSNPFFGYLLAKQKITNASTWLKTAAVDGVHFFYNTGFINSLNYYQVQFLICHELLHLIYRHLDRSFYPNGLRRNHLIFNIANDYIVNADALLCVSRKGCSFDIPNGAYIDLKYSNLSSEELYVILIKDLEKKAKELKEKFKKESKTNNENSNEDELDDFFNNALNDLISKTGSFDEHLDLTKSSSTNFDPNTISSSGNGDGFFNSSERPTYSERNIADNFNKFKGDLLIANSFKLNDAGNIPRAVIRVLDELNTPVITWQNYIRKEIRSLKQKKQSWSVPHRRSFDNNIILPSKIKKKEYNIHISIDASASVDDTMLTDFLSEVAGCCKQLKSVNLTIWTFDTEIHNVQTFNSRNLSKLKDYECIGNGGTIFSINWDYMKDNNIVPDIFIMFTDGDYFDSPGIAGYCKTLYIIPDYCNPKIENKYGKVIKYKKVLGSKR